MKGADVVAEILKREGTEFLSCYPRNPLIEACSAIDIRPVLFYLTGTILALIFSILSVEAKLLHS